MLKIKILKDKISLLVPWMHIKWSYFKAINHFPTLQLNTLRASKWRHEALGQWRSSRWRSHVHVNGALRSTKKESGAETLTGLTLRVRERNHFGCSGRVYRGTQSSWRPGPAARANGHWRCTSGDGGSASGFGFVTPRLPEPRTHARRTTHGTFSAKDRLRARMIPLLAKHKLSVEVTFILFYFMLHTRALYILLYFFLRCFYLTAKQIYTLLSWGEIVVQQLQDKVGKSANIYNTNIKYQ